jgi:hypothetical protein
MQNARQEKEEFGHQATGDLVARPDASASTAAAAFSTTVPSKNRGLPAPHNRTALAKVKSRKSSAVVGLLPVAESAPPRYPRQACRIATPARSSSAVVIPTQMEWT